MRYEVIPLSDLRPHEEFTEDSVRSLAYKIRRAARFTTPVCVDEEYRIILDGHHRAEALKRIGCRLVPAYLFPYPSNEVSVTIWPGCGRESITEQEIINAARAGRKFPSKTSRHIFHTALKEVEVMLAELY